jgi:hypothetical protein
MCNVKYFERKHLNNIVLCDRYNFETECLKVGSFVFVTDPTVGRDSSVGMATPYGLDGPEIDPWWGKVFRNPPDRPWGPPSLLYIEYRDFPGVTAAEAWRRPPIPIWLRD